MGDSAFKTQISCHRFVIDLITFCLDNQVKVLASVDWWLYSIKRSVNFAWYYSVYLTQVRAQPFVRCYQYFVRFRREIRWPLHREIQQPSPMECLPCIETMLNFTLILSFNIFQKYFSWLSVVLSTKQISTTWLLWVFFRLKLTHYETETFNGGR